MMQSNGFFICDKQTITKDQSKTCLDHTNNLLQHIIYLNYSLDHKIMVVEIQQI